MENKIREMANKRRWKGILKRSVALLCAAVMLFTMNTLKRNANTLERIPMCGYAEHVHSASCYSGDELVCGMTEHVHTDACYQESPASMDMDDLDIEVDGPIVDATVGNTDLSLVLDDLDLVVEDVAAEPASNTAETMAYSLGAGAMVSQIIEAVGLDIRVAEIKEIGAVENDEAHSGLIAVEKVDGDYRVWAQKSFAEAELALIVTGDVYVVKLRDGVAQSAPADTPVARDVIDVQAGADEQPAVQDVTDAQGEADELSIVEGAVSVDGQILDDDPVELPAIEAVTLDDGLELDGQLVIDDGILIEDMAPVADEQPADDENAPAEDAAPAEDEEREDAPVEEAIEAQDEEQPVEEAIEAQDEELPAEEAIEAQDEELPAEEAAEAQDEELPAEEAIEAQDEEQPVEVMGEDQLTEEAIGEQDEDQLAEEAAEAQGEDQPAEEAAGEQGEEQPGEVMGEDQLTEEVTEAQGEDQPAEEAAGEQDEDQPVEEAIEEQGEEQPAEEAIEAQDEEQPTEEAAGEQDEDQPAEEAIEEQGEEQPTEEAADEQDEEQPGEVMGEDQLTEEAIEEQGEDQPGEEAAGEQGEDQPGEEAAGEQDEEQPEEAAGEQGEEQPEEAAGEQDEEQPAEEAAEEQDEDQPVEEAAGEQGEEQPEEAAGEQGEEQPEEAAGEQDEEQPAEEAAGEQGEEQPEEEVTEAQGEDQPAEEAAGEQGEEQPEEAAGEQGEEQPGEEVAGEQDEEQPAEEAAGEQGEEQPADETEQPVYTAVIDLSGVKTYPLYLDTMLMAAAPEKEQAEAEAAEEETDEEGADEAADAAPEAEPTLTIEYDTELLDVVEQDGNHLITPVQSFEETRITVNFGIRYELTLVNCTLEAEEQPEEQAGEQPGEQNEPVRTATIDLTDATYPLSLNDMITAAEPAQEAEPSEAQPAAEQSEAQPEEAPEEQVPEEEQSAEQPTLTIEYDEALLSVAEADGDHLVTPIQSFESTRIIVENGSRYELTLVNCALADEAGEAQEIAYPAQDFEGRTDFVKVTVSAPEGAFPEGTTMTVVDVEDEKTLTDIEDTVNKGFVEVDRVHAVDIIFTDAAGNEIEPLVPISVVMTVDEIGQEEAAVLVHVDDAGEAKVVESQSEAPEGETGLKAEMPAAQGTDAADAQQASMDEATEGEAQTEVGFEADSFSVYAVVVTHTLETKYIDAKGDTWNISVRYGAEAEIPDTAALAVSEVTDERYLADAEAALEGGKRVTLARFFDIKIMDGETEVQPKQPVEVSIALDNTEIAAIEPQPHVIDNGETEVCAVHFDEEKTDIVTAAETEEAVVFDAEGFSVWGVMYTVDFYYGDYEYHMPGEESIALSALFDVLEIEADAAQAEEVVFTSPELVDVARLEDGSDWLLTSLAPFDTEEKLTVTMDDGTVYEIRVTDAQYDYRALVNDGNMGYFVKAGNNDLFVKYTNSDVYQYVSGVVVYNNQIVEYKVPVGGRGDSATAKRRSDNYRMAYWLKIKDNVEEKINSSDNNEKDGQTVTWQDRGTLGDALFVAYFAPSDAKVIVINDNIQNGSIGNTRGEGFRYPYTANGATISQGRYLYSTDNATLTATPSGEYFFKGWYDDDGALYSTNRELKTNEVNQDIVLTPVFEKNYKYNVIANTVKHKTNNGNTDVTIDPAKFSIPDWWDWNSAYGEPQTALYNLGTERMGSMDLCSFRFPVKTQSNNSNYVFAYWLKDDGTAPVVDGTDLAGFLNSDGSMRDKYNGLDRNTTFVAFYKPVGDYIVRINKPAEGGQFEHKAVWNWVDGTRKVQYDNKTLFEYYFAKDHPLINAIPADGWYFDGWYNNGTEKISSDQFFNVYEYVYGEYYKNDQFPDCHLSTALTPHKKDLNLTPVFKKKVDYFNVWFDGSDGIGGGEVGNDTFYTRINGKGNVEGSTSVYMKVAKQGYNSNNPKSGSATITLPTTAVNPQRQDSNKFELQGWYEIYTGKYYSKGETVTITGDAVFYADWMPSNYNIGQNSNVAPTVDTSSFITTRMYDYNNLFNMESIYLDLGRSSASMPADAQSLGYNTQKGDLPWTQYNKEYWYMNGDSKDFIFMSTVSGKGRSLNPYGRDEKNQNRETSTNGKYYTAIPTQGLLTSSLRDKLFDEESETLGKNYAGTANHLYQYDASTGYYYYDSDKNAASFNANDHRFYVYNYTNKTNKSNGGDNTDFLPFNYGNSEFSEMYGAPNYWFGMSSQIDFFLPNPTGYRDDNGVTGNRSVLGDEMVYKFAGDDDVWVFVDDQLVLDMGGVHGKIYGEINFSRGTWTIAYNGADKTVDNRNIMSYNDGSTLSGTLNDIGEGDHTLTLYYLERGASQSNCAIYFNLAPRYQLRFKKMDSLDKNGLQGARFGVYADAACTVAADLKHWNETTNEFTSGSDGIVHAQGLAAGRTYYIKELQAPTNYPDMSGFVMALTLDSHGNPTITVPAGAANMVDTSGLEAVSGKERTYKLNMVNGQPDMIYLPILNNSETSITATKTWSLLDGKEYRTFELDGKLITEYENSAASVKVQLQRYYEDDHGEAVENHTVQLVTQYFGSDSGTSNRDDASLSHYQTETRTVGDGGTVSFSLATDTGAGIYSVVSTGGSLSANVTGTTEGKPFKVNGSSANRPNAGNYTVSNIRNDAVIYITVIGAANSEADLMGKVHLTGVQATNGDGTARRISRDTGFNDDPKDKNDEDIPDKGEVTLSKANGWTHTWQNLATVDEQGHRVYYYVVEKDPVTPQSAALGGASAFIKTTSSDGLSGGIITVHNTLQAVKVKLRKRDAAKVDGNRVDLAGGEFYIFTEAAYNNGNYNISNAYAPQSGLITFKDGKPVGMGQNSGAKLLTDALGRFYTGFLPNGTYYIVEANAPDGYQRLAHPIRIVISEKGLSYDLNDGNGLIDRKPDSEGIYNLFIDNTMDKGSIRIQKQWKSNSNYGLVRGYENDSDANPPAFGLDAGKLYTSPDNGATAVLLSLGCVVNGAVDAGAVSDVYDNPTSHGLTADQIVNRGGTRYIRLAKEQSGWPTLTVSNLPLKHYADVTYTADDGQTATHKAPVDGWYFIEEYGYEDATGNVILVADKTDDWKVSYGYANGATNGSGKTENVAGTSRNLIRAKNADPDTLTVTNGFFGRLSFDKQDGSGHPVQGATFKLVPNAAGANNFVTNGDVDLVLTSNASGVVEIPTLPMGMYWLQEQSAPEGYRLLQDWYRVEIGYPTSAMYRDDAAVSVIDNPPVGALKLTKTVKMNGSAPAADDTHTDGTYEFSIDGLGSTSTEGIHRTVKITFAGGVATSWQIDEGEEQPVANGNNSWSVTVPDLTPGQYTVTEVPPTNDTVLWEASGGTKVDEDKKIFVTVVALDVAAAETSAQASFTNSYNRVDVKIVKIDESTRGQTTPKKLKEAEFKLIKGDEANGTVSYNSVYKYTRDGNEVEAIETTDDRGELAFENLPDGYYRIEESGVPAGYIRTSDPYIYFTISGGVLTWTDESQVEIADATSEVNLVTYSPDDTTFIVGNNPGAALPNTGGFGTAPIYAAGTALLLLALALLLRRKSEY